MAAQRERVAFDAPRRNRHLEAPPFCRQRGEFRGWSLSSQFDPFRREIVSELAKVRCRFSVNFARNRQRCFANFV